MRTWLRGSVAMSTMTMVLVGAGAVAGAQVGDDALDPVVRDVVRMLEAQVGAETITTWLETSGQRPQAIAADDLIALTRAGAPEALVQLLLGATAASPTPAPPVAPTVAPPAPVAPTPQPPAPAVPDRFASRAPVDVSFRVDYRPEVQEAQRGWDYFVYLDGDLLLWSDGGAHAVLGAAVESTRKLAPGRHVVRILQEQHVPQTIGRPWRHSARVLPMALELELERGARYTVEIEHVEQKISYSGADDGVVSWVVRRDGQSVGERRDVGPDPEKWPYLCEEVKADMSPDKWDSRSGRRALEGCLSWTDLFPGVAEVPDRDAIRALLEEHKFRPVPLI